MVKDVADSLCFPTFMLSKWRKQVREGVLVCKSPQIDPDSVTELKRLQMDHDLLKNAIRFASDLKTKSSLSSRQTGKPTRSK